MACCCILCHTSGVIPKVVPTLCRQPRSIHQRTSHWQRRSHGRISWIVHLPHPKNPTACDCRALRAGDPRPQEAHVPTPCLESWLHTLPHGLGCPCFRFRPPLPCPWAAALPGSGRAWLLPGCWPLLVNADAGLALHPATSTSQSLEGDRPGRPQRHQGRELRTEQETTGGERLPGWPDFITSSQASPRSLHLEDSQQ